MTKTIDAIDSIDETDFFNFSSDDDLNTNPNLISETSSSDIFDSEILTSNSTDFKFNIPDLTITPADDDDVFYKLMMQPKSPFIDSTGSLSPYLSLDSLAMADDLSEGYLSPRDAFVGHLSPNVIQVPSPLIRQIQSPFTESLQSLDNVNTNLLHGGIWDKNQPGLGLTSTHPTFETNTTTFEQMMEELGLETSNFASLPLSSDDLNIKSITKLKSEKKQTLYQCPFPNCLKTYTRPYNLKSHYRQHTGEKPFKCDDCGQLFVRKHDWKRHCKLHEGVRPYICKICKKGFARSDALKRHYKSSENGKLSACYIQLGGDDLNLL